MKRNWDIIRELLTKVEKCTLPTDMIHLSDFPSERAAEISYHMALLIDARLVEGQMVKTLGPDVKNFFVQRLTWSGHEFIDAIRSENVWQKTKNIFAEQGISMTFDLIKEEAKSVAATLLGSAL